MASGFHLIPAHSVAALAEAFAARIRRRANPLRPETVLIMNYAQRVWLQRFLAEKLGVCANLEFKSPEAFLEECAAAPGGKKVFGRGALAWRIFETLKALHAPGAGTPPEFLFDLNGKPERDFFARAVELGDLFWRYQSFRPHMIRDWTRGAPDPKNADPDFLAEYRRQKNLWRALAFGDAEPPAAAWLRLLESAAPIAGTPPRVFAFAPSALPRIHVELLEKLAESSEVFLFYHNLSHTLWTESEEEKKRLRERLRCGNSAAPEDALAADAPEGNELLAAWGKAARPLAAHLIDAGLLDENSTLDAPPERDSLLHALQREIRDDAPAPRKFVPEENDRSLRISAAPNPMREMEILRDELTARFAADPNLRPRDVLVLLADLEAYAPFVRAVFENSGIPFSVADRSDAEIFPAAAAFSEILRAAQGEFRLDEILALAELEIVRKNLGLEEDELSVLRETLADAGIRWGADADFRRERIFGGNAPESEMRAAAETLAENNSWAFGLRRLALGFMCGNDDESGEILSFGKTRAAPVPALAESAPDALGKIFRLVKILETLNRAFAEKTPRSVPAWCAFLQEILADGLLDAGDGEAEILRETLADARDAALNASRGGNAPECRLETLVDALAQNVRSAGARGGSGMLRGKVTFCEMQPMRNIPAKIICIAGLSDGAFPRAAARSRFDLLAFPAKNFPAGTALWDRSARDDDCLLFLESILAARDALLLSYAASGSEGAGKAAQPCVPLAKLRDALLEIVSEKSDAPGAPSFETRHRLHGFSPDYFSADAERSRKFFSFSRADYATARRGNGKNAEAQAGADGGNVFPAARVPAEIPMRELAKFFVSPAKFICRNALGIAPESVAAVPETDDPQELFSALDASRLHRELFEKRLAERVGGAAVPASAEEEADELKIFRARELAAGRTPALAEDGEFEAALAKKLKDAAAFADYLPRRLFRVPEAEIPPEISLPAAAGTAVKIPLSFERLFRDETGALFLALAGKKSFGWRVAAECFVCAQMLAAAFPREAFAVAYFAYGEKSPLRVTSESLRRSRMTPQELTAFFAEKISAPPFLFEKTPLVSEKISEDDFFRLTRRAWAENADARDACDAFVFGGNDAPDAFGKNIRETAFPFVRAVCASFE